ncbi:MAG: PTS transporter subunit EIIC [Kofleriaceae bacterium]
MAGDVTTTPGPVIRALERIAAYAYIRAIRDGVIATLPITLIGSCFLLIAKPPHEGLASTVAPYAEALLIPTKVLTGAISLYLCFAVAYALAKIYELDPVSTALLAVAGFLVAMEPAALAAGGWGLGGHHLGSSGVAGALVIAILVVEGKRAFVRHDLLVIRLPPTVPEAVTRSFQLLIPSFVCIAIIWVVVHLLGVDLLGGAEQVAAPLRAHANSGWFVVVLVLAASSLWFVGIPSYSILAPLQPIWIAMITENIQATANGLPAQHLVTGEFLVFFVMMGGTGGALALGTLMLFARSRSLRKVARLGIVPSLFNIGEPIVFGTPVVLNRRLLVPFLLAPVINALVTWCAMSWDWVGKPILQVPSTLPAPLGAFLCTGGDARVFLLQLITLPVTALVWWPFLRAYDRAVARAEAMPPIELSEPTP